MNRIRFAAAAAALLFPFAASASFHLVHITEVYSNADGTVQFIELESEASNQNLLSQAELIAFSANGATQTTILNITTNLASFNAGQHALFATAAAQSALGFSADYTIPANSIILTNGRVKFQQDGGSGLVPDAVAYGAYTGSNTGFGTPAPALPTDGVMSLTRTADLGTNNTDFTAQTNSPTNSAGQTGSLGGSAVGDWDLYE